ncbi:hypothetical protein, partial [Pseudomonas aeruginosa]|uniref:hypothetical protein n=1 Tax=Pseudomonas aeruginosa TaxID=287 RepID=UPI001FD3AF90
NRLVGSEMCIRDSVCPAREIFGNIRLISLDTNLMAFPINACQWPLVAECMAAESSTSLE